MCVEASTRECLATVLAYIFIAIYWIAWYELPFYALSLV